MEEEKNISKEIILPKLWFLILGVITALLLPPIGLIWGIVLFVKKYRVEGIIMLSAAIIGILIGLIVIYQELLPGEGPGALEEGQILPEELYDLTE